MRQHRVRQLRIRQLPERAEVDPRNLLRNVQPAVGGEPFEQDLRETLWLRAAARADVSHVCLPLWVLLPLLLQLVELAHLLRRRLAVRGLLGGRLVLRLFLRQRRQAQHQRCGEEEEPHSSASRRRRTILPTTVGSRSIFAIAWFTFFSRAWCVSMTISTRLSPSPGSFCTMASIEILQSASKRVMSASTPGLSITRMRR